MATYRTINPSELLAGQGITESLMTALAENPKAIQEADDTAPKISPYALDSGTIGIVDYTIGTDEISLALNHGYDSSKTVLLFVSYENSANDIRLRRNGSNLYFYASNDSTTYVHALSVGTGTTTFNLIRNSGNLGDTSIVALVLS